MTLWNDLDDDSKGSFGQFKKIIKSKILSAHREVEVFGVKSKV